VFIYLVSQSHSISAGLTSSFSVIFPFLSVAGGLMNASQVSGMIN